MKAKNTQAIFSDAGGILFDDSFAKLREYKFIQQYLSFSYQDFSRVFYPFKLHAQVAPDYTKKDAFKDFLHLINRSELYGHYDLFCEEYSQQHFADPSHLLIPGVKETLERIQQEDVPFIVLTDTTSTKKDCEEFYRRLGIDQYLTDIFSSTDLQVKKPHPYFFDSVLSKHPFPKEEVLFVGHDWDELYGAHSYGFQVAAMQFKPEIKQALKKLAGIRLLKTFPDLLSLVE